MFWREAGSDLGTDHVWKINREIGLPLAGIVEGICKLIGVETKFTRKGFQVQLHDAGIMISARLRRDWAISPLWTIQEGVRLGTRWDAEQRKMEAEKKGQ